MKLSYLAAVGACLSIGAGGPVWAAPASLHEDLSRVEAEGIARDAAWLALLHYRVQSGGGVSSEADQASFFLSGDGKRSPHAELLAAVAALHTPARRQEFACRFPARYEWLRTRLGQADGGASIERCPDVAAWMQGFPGRRISIDFASSYLESPSSTFGHTFLKVFERSADELLSPTINYAARSDARDGDLAFVVKGLFGGFPGVVDALPFYRRLRTYTEIEGRDIHEYELALAPAEVRRLLLHAWEIRNGVFDYYFVHENCAYRTLALLDVARPGAGLLKRFSAATVPVDTLRALRSAGLLGEHRVWPSLPKQVRDLETQVAQDDARLARQVALGLATPAEAGALPPPRRADTLRLAYEYGAVLIDRDQGDRASRKEILGTITSARLERDEPKAEPGRPPAANPEDGHDGGLLGIKVGRRAGRGTLTLEYAAFHHALTSPVAGYEPHAEISVLHPVLEIRDGHVRLRHVDWLLTQSAIPSSTLFAPRAWRLQLSTGKRPFADREHTVSSASYQVGKSWALGRNTVLTILPGAAIEAGSVLRNHAALGAMVDASVTRQGPRWAAQLGSRSQKLVAGAALRRQECWAAAEAPLSRNLSIAFGASWRTAPLRERELSISLKWRQRSLGHLPGRE